jgi:hypothetical protein
MDPTSQHYPNRTSSPPTATPPPATNRCVVFLRRYSLHTSPDLHPTPLPPQRLPKRLLLHGRTRRWDARRLRRPCLRFNRQKASKTQQRRLRSRIPHPRVHNRSHLVRDRVVHIRLGARPPYILARVSLLVLLWGRVFCDVCCIDVRGVVYTVRRPLSLLASRC